MRIKKAGGKVFGAVLTAAERKAMDMEIYYPLAENVGLGDTRHEGACTG